MSVKSAADVKKYAETFQKHSEKMQEVSGLSCDISLEVDWLEIEELVKDNYDGRCGEVVQSWIIGGLSGSIEKLCADSTAQESLQSTWFPPFPKLPHFFLLKFFLFSRTTGVIKLEIVDNMEEKGYHFVYFSDGDLVIKSTKR